ncbi:MAG: DUF1624 domain-containing protein [Methanoregula sp.]|jgi:uncharacterized membrane protein|nr:DUF1624 domain-containing protein [Methanoregula sp.]
MTPAPTWTLVPFRDRSVDLLRGLAIAVMVAANMIPFLLVPPAPFWLRVLASVAAPLFIFLSGMMVALSFRLKKHTFSYFLIRGGFVVLLGVLIDLLARGAVPFLDFDVLYLIGISLPLSYLFLKLDLRRRMLIFLSIIIVTPLMQAFFGYSGLPLQVQLIPVLSGSALPAGTSILRQWLIEGWFPVFPWLAVALLGAHTGTFRWQESGIRSFVDRKLALPVGGAFVIGVLFWYLLPGPALTPYGYVELFYPPTMEFLLFITGLIFCLFIAADWLVTTPGSPEPLQVLGQCSLAIYVVHTLIIDLCILPLQLRVSLPLFLIAYLVFIALMTLLAYGIRSLRLRLDHPPFIVKVLIGG